MFKFHKNIGVLLKRTDLSLDSCFLISVMGVDLGSMMAKDFLALGFSSPGQICWKQEKAQGHQGASLRRRKRPALLGKWAGLLPSNSERGLGHCNWTLGSWGAPLGSGTPSAHWTSLEGVLGTANKCVHCCGAQDQPTFQTSMETPEPQ